MAVMSEFGEGVRHSVSVAAISSEIIMPSTNILHQRMTGCDNPG